MLDGRSVAEALGWLGDLGNRPDTSPATPEGRSWLARLSAEVEEARASGPELVAAARDLARAGGFFPTPGALVERVRERRLAAVREERERAWHTRDPAPAGSARIGSGGAVPDGWTRGRSMAAVHRQVVDLVRRGHGGLDLPPHEHYVAAVLREERERVAVEAEGGAWKPPRYGPSLVAWPNGAVIE